MKIINIYLTPEEKHKLVGYKEKYHLSFSTLADIITDKVYMLCKKNIEDHYIDNKKGIKTSIKPRCYQYKSIIITNAIKIFVNDLWKKYTDRPIEEVNKCKNMIYNQFQNTFDDNWNGNYQTRFMAKFIKKNPDYVRKLLEQ